MHLGGGRRVLNELDQLILVDHAARAHADVAADLERGVVGHRDPALDQILGEQAKPFGQAGAAGFHRELQRLRIRGQRVGRAQRVGHLSQGEAPLCLGAVVQRRGIECLAHQLRLRQIGPGDQVVAGVLVPGFGAEPSVRDRLRGQAQRRPRCRQLTETLRLPFRERLHALRPRVGGGGPTCGVLDRPEHRLGGLEEIGEPLGRIRKGLRHVLMVELLPPVRHSGSCDFPLTR